MTKKKIYLASTWFEDINHTYKDQLERLDKAKDLLHNHESIDNVYVPNEHQSSLLPEFGKEWQKDTFQMDIDNLASADIVVALLDYNDNGCTDDGIAFELGYAYSNNIPVVTLKLHHDGNMNLMIAQSTHSFLHSFDELKNYDFDKMPVKETIDKVF